MSSRDARASRQRCYNVLCILKSRNPSALEAGWLMLPVHSWTEDRRHGSGCDAPAKTDALDTPRRGRFAGLQEHARRRRAPAASAFQRVHMSEARIPVRIGGRRRSSACRPSELQPDHGSVTTRSPRCAPLRSDRNAGTTFSRDTQRPRRTGIHPDCEREATGARGY